MDDPNDKKSDIRPALKVGGPLVGRPGARAVPSAEGGPITGPQRRPPTTGSLPGGAPIPAARSSDDASTTSAPQRRPPSTGSLSVSPPGVLPGAPPAAPSVAPPAVPFAPTSARAPEEASTTSAPQRRPPTTGSITGAMPTAAPAAVRASGDPIADALGDEYLEDQDLWSFGELKDMRALAPRAITRDRRGAQAFDGSAVYVALLARGIAELAAQKFILRVEARLAKVDMATVLPAPLLRLSEDERRALIAPPVAPVPEPPRPPPPAQKSEPAPAAFEPVAVDPKIAARDAARVRAATRAVVVSAVVAVAGAAFVVARAASDVEVSETAVLRAPAGVLWDVASGLEHQAKVMPWLEGAAAPEVDGDLMRTQHAGVDTEVFRWNVSPGQRVEMRVRGEETLASRIDLAEEQDGVVVTWTLTGPRGLAGAFGGIEEQRRATLKQGLSRLEKIAHTVAEERKAEAERAAAEQAALIEAVNKARVVIDPTDPGGEGGDEHVDAPPAEGAAVIDKPTPVSLTVEPKKPPPKKKPKRR